MADKLLKSIKFPTLPDRYVIGDTSLSEEGAAADAKAVGEAIATKADTKGTYEDLIVGGAEQLMADEYETDKEPYLFRTTGGSADVGNREYLDKIVGGTVAWNQIVQNGNFADTSVWSSPYVEAFSVASNEATVTFKNGTFSIFGQPIGIISGHKYFCSVSIKGDAEYNTIICQLGGNQIVHNYSITTSYANEQFVFTANADAQNFNIARDNAATGQKIYLKNVMLVDLTQAFGITIADYIRSLEQATAGAGVAWFRRYFPEDYYPYHAVSLESIQTSAHKTYDADGNVIGNYALDSSLTLRGVPKLADGKLAFDGDVYPPSGEVQRRYGLRAYQSGDESLADAITDGTNTVYKLATPTTETADGYEQYQRCDPSGTEEFVTTGIVPVGHETRYPHDLKKKIETAPDSPSTDGTYLMKRSGGKNTYMALPSTPSANGAYVLTVTVSGGTASYSWTAKE